MRRAPLFLTGILTFTGALIGATPLFGIDSFYLGLLRDGIHAYDRKDYAAAAQDLRLACFGMLDEPKSLAACLARLGLAQDKAGDAAGFRETFRRIAEVEERFGAYTQAELPPEVRTALEQRLAAVIPAPTLESVPAFRGLAGRKSQAGQASVQSAEAQERGRRGQTPSRTAETTPAPASGSPSAAGAAAAQSGPKPVSETERAKMAEARKLLDASEKTRDLRRAFELARQVADACADSAAAQHLAGEAAYRLSRWADATAYFRRGGEPTADQPELLFYMAVALYESGDKKAAAVALERSLPKLQRTPYVESYAKKILR